VGADNAFTVHTRSNLPVNKNGYLYVYVSNETTNLDVFFDNLQVTHIHGPIVEETHYYPFGLTMAGISSKAAGGVESKKKFNDGTELNTTFDVNLYETNFRSLDPQLGRFWQVDPMADAAYDYSPYAYGNNNPLTFNDPLGLLSDSLHPVVLETVTVTSKPKVGNQFLPYIHFPNGGTGTIASYKDWPLTFSKNRSNDMLDSYTMGLGAENRIYLPNHPMTKRMINAYQVKKAKAFFYKKYMMDYKKGQPLKGASVTKYDGTFGFGELALAGGDLDIQMDEGGENVLFILSNTTGNKSAFYHLPFVHDTNRNPNQVTPGGNLNQVYIWQEPLDNVMNTGFTNTIGENAHVVK
jgi:RHS repeat-associated protein